MLRFSDEINGVVRAIGCSRIFETPDEIAAVIRACSVGVCELKPDNEHLRTKLRDPNWNVTVGIGLTARGITYGRELGMY